MTQTGVTNAIVNIMAGWMKGLASWVLKLFNLAGSGGNPLLWLSQNWLKLLILLLAAGVILDWLVWMIRWRPYWVWMRKKRVVVNDERLLRDDGENDSGRRYVVPSAVVPHEKKHRPSRLRGNSVKRRTRRAVRPANHRRVSGEILADGLFEVGQDGGDVSDFSEDEVFNVSSLPDVPPARRNRRGRR